MLTWSIYIINIDKMLVFGERKSTEEVLSYSAAYTIYGEHCSCLNCDEYHIDSITCDICNYDLYSFNNSLFGDCYSQSDIENVILDKYKNTCPKCKVKFITGDEQQSILDKYMLV